MEAKVYRPEAVTVGSIAYTSSGPIAQFESSCLWTSCAWTGVPFKASGYASCLTTSIESVHSSTLSLHSIKGFQARIASGTGLGRPRELNVHPFESP